jgi:hypothetical protein
MVVSTEYLLKLGDLRIGHKVSQNVQNIRLFTSLRDRMDILSLLAGAPINNVFIYEVSGGHYNFSG